MTDQPSWNVINLINTTTAYFQEKHIENPRLNAEQLLGHVLNLDRVELYLSYERPVHQNELAHYRKLVRRRAKFEPLQYILGKTEFMGLPFCVRPGVLIPRPETEQLVEEIIETINEQHLQSARVLDIGTGSGCIAISLKKEFPGLDITAIDTNQDILDVAIENGKRNALEGIRYIVHDIFTLWPENMDPDFDIIVSNPPYISEAEWKHLPQEVREYEPLSALTDHADGLNYYKHIFSLLHPGSRIHAQYLFMEMSGTNSQAITALAEGASFRKTEIRNDYNDIPRILKIKVT
jgi:release factor glutamine methyltransferase